MYYLWNLQAKIEAANAILCWSSWRNQQACQSEGSSFWSQGCYDGKHWKGKTYTKWHCIEVFNRVDAIIHQIYSTNLDWKFTFSRRFLIVEKRLSCSWIRLTTFGHRFHFLLYSFRYIFNLIYTTFCSFFFYFFVKYFLHYLNFWC